MVLEPIEVRLLPPLYTLIQSNTKIQKSPSNMNPNLQLLLLQQQMLLLQSQMLMLQQQGQQSQQTHSIFAPLPLQSLQVNNPQTLQGQGQESLDLEETVYSLHTKYLASIPNAGTKQTYSQAFKQFFEQGFLDPNQSLEDFSKANLEMTLDNIRQNIKTKQGLPTKPWSAQTSSSAFISFTAFLQRYTKGLIRKVLLLSTGLNKTYSYKQDKSSTSLLSISQVKDFLFTLKEVNPTAHLIGLIQYAG